MFSLSSTVLTYQHLSSASHLPQSYYKMQEMIILREKKNNVCTSFVKQVGRMTVRFVPFVRSVRRRTDQRCYRPRYVGLSLASPTVRDLF